MAELLIATDLPSPSELASTPLRTSLDAAAVDATWTLDPSDERVIATVMVDHDTELRPGALDLVLATLAAHPEIDLMTADGRAGSAWRLRGAWSPTRIAASPDELDLVIVRGRVADTSLLGRALHLFAADPTRIGHLPAVLAERATDLTPSPSTASSIATLLTDRYSAPEIEAISIVIPTAGFLDDTGTPFVTAAIDAVRRGGIARIEILLVVGEEFVGDAEALCEEDVRLVHRPPGSWNFSAAVNLGVLAARHEHILVLNDDVEAIADGWLAALATPLRDPGVGAVGALLLFPDHTVQHAGMVIDDAVPLHCFAGWTLEDLQAVGGHRPREMAAVTGACLLARRADLLAVGGLNEGLPFNFNDVDLCFKFLRRGQRVVFNPEAMLVHHEGASREPVTHGWEWDRFVHRWGHVVDPWYHPAFLRPDDPGDRRRNADHLLPGTVPEAGELRTAVVRSDVHEARLRSHEGTTVPE